MNAFFEYLAHLGVTKDKGDYFEFLCLEILRQDRPTYDWYL